MTPARPFLLLDLAGVLLRFEPDRRVARLAASCGRSPTDIRAAIESSGITDRLDTGRADEHVLARVLGGVLGREIGTVEAWDLWLAPFSPDTAVLAELPALTARFRLGLFTNNPRAITRVFDPSPFERMFFSAELGAKKPDPSTYRTVARTLGVAAHEIVFVDDGAANLDGARRAGWRAIAFRDGDRLATLLGD